MDLRRRYPPVLAGIIIGFSMLLAFVVSGRGIGASGAMTDLVASVQHLLLPALTEKSTYFAPYFANGHYPLGGYLDILMLGLLLGAFVAAWTSGDFKIEVQRGPRISVRGRLIYALIGGVITGYAARLARGCTSGQGLVGGAELSVGAWTFLVCIFIGGFGAAWFVRKQWI